MAALRTSGTVPGKTRSSIPVLGRTHPLSGHGRERPSRGLFVSVDTIDTRVLKPTIGTRRFRVAKSRRAVFVKFGCSRGRAGNRMRCCPPAALYSYTLEQPEGSRIPRRASNAAGNDLHYTDVNGYYRYAGLRPRRLNQNAIRHCLNQDMVPQVLSTLVQSTVDEQ